MSKVKQASKREDVIEQLLTVMKTLDEQEFELMFKNYLSQLFSDSDCQPFYHYLIEGYGKKPEEWAYCYRKGLRINTNMALETMHRTLKHIYFEGNVVKRLDEAIHLLLKFLKDRQHDWIITETKGKSTKKSSLIFKKHKLAQDSQWNYAINPVDENVYLVHNMMTGTCYEVIIEDCCDCGDTCKLICKKCNCCLERISCTCPDYTTRFEFCKHCHLINMFRQNNFTIGYSIELGVECDDRIIESLSFDDNEMDDEDFFSNESPFILTSETIFLQHNYTKSGSLDELEFSKEINEPPSPFDMIIDDKKSKNEESIKRLRATFESLVQDLESDPSSKRIEHINDLLSKEQHNYKLEKQLKFCGPEHVAKKYKHKKKQTHQKRNLYSIKKKNVKKVRYSKLTSEKIDKIRQNLLKKS